MWRKHSAIKGRKRAEIKESAIVKVKELYDLDVSEDEAEAILIGEWSAVNISGENC